MVIKLLLLGVFFALMVAVGVHYRKAAANVDGFVLGSHRAGSWLTAFAYGTSYFSAVIFIGYAGQFGWKYGVASTWIGLGNALIGSLLAWMVLGRRTRLLSHHLDVATMPSFFAKRYDSNALKTGAALIVFIFLIPYTASLYNGLSRLFAMAFNMDYVVCIILMSLLTAVYVVAGGYMATAVNDFIQGLIMVGGIVAVVAAVLRQNGGFAASLHALALVEDSAVSATPGVFASFFGPDPTSLLAVIILTSLGTWGLPQMVQKFYAISSEKAIDKGTVVSTVFSLVVAGGCYFLGGFGRLFSDKVDVAAEGFDAIIPAMLSNLSPLLLGVIVILVLSASMSTLSSLVLTSSSTLTLDLLKEGMGRRMSEKSQMLVMRWLIVAFVTISAVIAIIQYRNNLGFIAQMMGLSWGALAGAFLAPFLYGLYWKRTSKTAVWVSFVFGCGLMIANMLCKQAFPLWLQSPINCGAFVMVANLALLPLVSLVSKAPDQDYVEAVFSCYDHTVVVPAKHSLGEGRIFGQLAPAQPE